MNYTVIDVDSNYAWIKFLGDDDTTLTVENPSNKDEILGKKFTELGKGTKVPIAVISYDTYETGPIAVQAPPD